MDLEKRRITLVAIILLLITGGFLLLYDRQNNNNLFTTTIPQIGEGGGPQPTTVTPKPQMYSGEIASLSYAPLPYKSRDAMPVIIHENNIPLLLFVSTDTQVYTSTNKLVPRSYLQSGMSIEAEGIPVEGGIDVTRVRIQTEAERDEMRRPETTLSPTTQASPTMTIAPTATISPTVSVSPTP